MFSVGSKVIFVRSTVFLPAIKWILKSHFTAGKKNLKSNKNYPRSNRKHLRSKKNNLDLIEKMLDLTEKISDQTKWNHRTNREYLRY